MTLGMLDWGVGGLGCYRLLRARWPDLPVVYCSDTGAVPYGRLAHDALRDRVEQLLLALVEQGATQLAVACHAASTVIDDVRVPVPTLGMFEAALRMVSDDFAGTLGILGGQRTIDSKRYQTALARADRSIIARVAQPLSAHIESGLRDAPQFERDLAEIMTPLHDADAILLACTHYPSISRQIGELAPTARLLDPAQALVSELERRGALAGSAGGTRFLCTGDPEAMRRAAWSAWGVIVERVEGLRVPER